ncbi:MAG: carbon starvation protein A [Armatimonadota bacterium]|nr:carbon starvation protein A [Armatimonadota bacterium]MCX7777617.1 carbon starvation protein A [Armatimonadota bacterium]MDW8024705.1 carbon starvation protein A [Armatimonadota bacterium]
MNAGTVSLLCAVAFLAAYIIYGRFLGRKVFSLREDTATPAHELNDGVDYVPTPPAILFGHHFASIAGLGPIIGPAIAAIWGWLPALLWIIFGTIFVGAVHDMSVLSTSIRHGARSIGDIAVQVIGKRARLLFLAFIFFALSLAMGVFVLQISKLFAPPLPNEWSVPEAVFPSIALIALAVAFGTLRNIYGINLTMLTCIGFLLMMLCVIVGTQMPITEILGFKMTPELWSYALLAYAYVASLLPVWLLLQPRDYLNSYLLYLGMTLLFVGIVLWRPQIAAPAINQNVPDPKPLFPLLFITVACGAVSGFHSLVSSGTTAKQLDKETHAIPVAYGGMLTEGMLAVLVLMACVAGFGAYEEWVKHYTSHKQAGNSGLLNFISGASNVLLHVGIPVGAGKVLIATVAVSFALTTLDTATRLLRYNIEEIAQSLHITPLTNRYISSLVAVAAIGFFALLRVGGKPVGLVLWQLFGASNQLLAALALLTVTLYLRRLGRQTVFTLLPMVFMCAVTISALVTSLFTFISERNIPLLIVDACLLVLAGWLIVEAIISAVVTSTTLKPTCGGKNSSQ